MKRTNIKCPITGHYLLDPTPSFDYYEYRVEGIPNLIWCYNGWTSTYSIKGDPQNRHYHLNKNDELVEDKPVAPIEWDKVEFPKINVPIAHLIPNEIVSVQPMKESRKDVNWLYKSPFKYTYKYGPSWRERIQIWLSKRALKKALKKKGLPNE